MHRVLLFSDIHFDINHRRLTSLFLEVVKRMSPSVLVGMGDLVDLGMLSTYKQGVEDPVHAIDQIKAMNAFVNQARVHAGRTILMVGNHDERWDKCLLDNNAQAFKGAKGLSFEEQTYSQGLHKSVVWYREGKDKPGLVVGRRGVILQHGHIPRRSFTGEHLAANQLRAISTMSSVRGHHHRAQLIFRTELGRTIFGLSMPHMSAEHSYIGGNPNWQRGFAVLDFCGGKRIRDCDTVFPHLVIADKYGRFTFEGKKYD